MGLNADDDNGDGLEDRWESGVVGENDLLKLRVPLRYPLEGEIPAGTLKLAYDSSAFRVYLDPLKENLVGTLDPRRDYTLWLEAIGPTLTEESRELKLYQCDGTGTPVGGVGEGIKVSTVSMNLVIGTPNSTADPLPPVGVRSSFYSFCKCIRRVPTAEVQNDRSAREP